MRLIVLYIILFSVPFSLIGQVEPDSNESSESVNIFMASLGYTSNSNNSRNANTIKMPALLSTLTYYNKSGLWASANILNYQNASELTYDAEFQLGFQKSFQEHFDIDVYYSNRNFKGDLAYEGINYDHSITVAGAYRLNNFTVDLDNEYMFGLENNYFLDISLSYDFSIEGILSKRDYLIISPTIIGSLGTTYWISDAMDHVWGGHSGGHHMGGFEPDNEFDYQRFSLIIPAMYSLGSFTISGGWFYSIPSLDLKDQNWGNQSGFLVSLIYSAIF